MNFAAADLETLRKSLASGDSRSVAAMLSQHSNVVSMNVERSAVQVKGCSGAIVAHFPMGQLAIERIARELHRIAVREVRSAGTGE